MRIAILNFTSRPPGGAGSYLRAVIPALARRGHDIGFWHELGEPPDGDPFALPAGSPSWSAERLGVERALASLAEWRPDLLFSHGLLDPGVEARTLQIAPAVTLAHAYYGTCISGAKMFKHPANRPCSRTFGWPCLAHYYPRRCGGWSPVVMVREFRRQSARLELLSRYRAIVTLSSHMQQEYARHGLEARWIRGAVHPGVAAAPAPARSRRDGAWHLVFVGRMDHAKGGRYLLDALPRVAAVLDRPVHVTFAGEGPARAPWQAAAAGLASGESRLAIDFAGWLDRPGIDALLASADVLVVPSLWPEPFALVGLEAARHRLPAAAFAVGGIPDWLRPGINGYLAPADPPTPGGLADAILACVTDPDMHAHLRDGAGRVAAEFDFDQHSEVLNRVLKAAAGVVAGDGRSERGEVWRPAR
jgi:glycosyltransferase involved in cell wall biosynthesis